MIDQKLIDMLICPETKLPLKLAENSMIEKLNVLISEGKIKNRSEQIVNKRIEGGLVAKENSTYLYPIIENIPILLTEEAIPLDQIS